MRAMRTTYVILAALFLVGAAVALYVGLTDDGVLKSMWLIFAGTGAFMAILFFAIGRYVGSVGGAAVKDGIPGVGRVVAVHDTGVTINNLNAVFRVEVMAEIPGSAPYAAELKMALGRNQWGLIQPGMTVPILAERSNPKRIAFDQSRPVLPAGMAGAAPGMPPGVVPGVAGVMPGAGTGGMPGAMTRSAADVIARGVATSGVLQAVTPMGMTAGQVAGGLPADQADDPIVQVAMAYDGPAGPTQTTMLVRVPDGKAGHLAPGARVPVRYLPDEPAVATIDWERL